MAGVAVAVGRPALVLAVVGQLDAVELELVLVTGRLAAGLLQSAVLLLPCHHRGWPAGGDRASKEFGGAVDQGTNI